MRLNEITENSKYLPMTNIIEVLKKNAPVALNKFVHDEVKLYRGYEKSSTSFYKDPPTERRSANTTNYYTVLIDNFLESWEEYPLRSKSFICSTNENTAYGYGGYSPTHTFTVFPVGNPDVGFTSEGDFWHSFPSVYKFLTYMNDRLTERHYGITLTGINDLFADIQDELFNKTSDGVESIKKTLEVIDSPEGRKQLENSPLGPILPYFENKSFLKEINDVILNPIRNEVYTDKLSDLDFDGRHEVWFSAPAYFINMYDMESIELLFDRVGKK